MTTAGRVGVGVVVGGRDERRLTTDEKRERKKGEPGGREGGSVRLSRGDGIYEGD